MIGGYEQVVKSRMKEYGLRIHQNRIHTQATEAKERGERLKVMGGYEKVVKSSMK